MNTTTQLDDLLQNLLSITPEAPHSDADPAEVLESAVIMLSLRELVLQKLREQITGPYQLSLDAASCLSALEERSLRWEAALRRARHELAQRLISVKRASY